MLTGIEKPTLGTASVLGFDTWGQWGEVQKLIGKKNYALKKIGSLHNKCQMNR